jgi:hypothetical protein
MATKKEKGATATALPNVHTFKTNLGDKECTVDLGEQPGQEGDPVEVFANREYETPKGDLGGLELDAYGYRWIRLRETPGL